MAKWYASLTEVDELKFKEGGFAITLKPHASSPYTAARTISLPNTDTDQEITGTTASQTLTNKTLTTPKITDAGAGDLIITSSNGALASDRTLSIDVQDADRTIDIAGNLTLAAAFTTSGANALTLTTSGATNVTLPTTGTLTATSNKLSDFAATTSAELASVISDETGTGVLVYNNTPTITALEITAGSTIDTAAAGTLGIGNTNATTVTIGQSGQTAVIAGNLQVDGTTTTVNSTTLDVTDANITINNGGNQAAANTTAGITVEMSDATDASILYDSSTTTRFKVGDAGAEVEVADISSTQNLSGKTFTDNEVDFSGTGAINIPAGNEAARPGSPTDGGLRFNSETSGWEGYNGSTWTDIGGGGGSGGINYITNPDAESNADDWYTYDDGSSSTPVDGANDGAATNIAITRNTTTPLRGDADFQIAKSNTIDAQGEGAGIPFAIDPADENKVLALSFDFDGSDGNYTADELGVYVYDVDNGALITPASVNLAAAKYTFVTTFVATDSTNYRLLFHQQVTDAVDWNVYTDNVRVGPQDVFYGTPSEDWTAFTPSLEGSSSNPTLADTNTFEGFYRRIGDSMHIRVAYEHTSSTGSANGSGNWQIALPDGFTLDTTKIPSPTNGESRACGNAIVRTTNVGRLTGSCVFPSDNSASIEVIAGDHDTADAKITYTGVVFNVATVRFSIDAVVPIAEWAGSSVWLSSAKAEYASDDGTWDSSTSSTVYSPAGQLMGGALTGTRTKTINWLTDIQPTDKIVIEGSQDGIQFYPMNETALGSGNDSVINILDSSGGWLSGVRMRQGATSKQTIVQFGRYMNIANDNSPTTDWPSSQAYWRVVKYPGVIQSAMPNAIKYEKIELGSDFSSTGSVTDLAHTLEVGKTYRIKVRLQIEATSGSSKALNLEYKDGSSAIGRINWSFTTSEDNITFKDTQEWEDIVTPTDGTMTLNVAANTGSNVLAGNTVGYAETYVLIEELPYHVETSEW